MFGWTNAPVSHTRGRTMAYMYKMTITLHRMVRISYFLVFWKLDNLSIYLTSTPLSDRRQSLCCQVWPGMMMTSMRPGGSSVGWSESGGSPSRRSTIRSTVHNARKSVRWSAQPTRLTTAPRSSRVLITPGNCSRLLGCCCISLVMLMHCLLLIFWRS